MKYRMTNPGSNASNPDSSRSEAAASPHSEPGSAFTSPPPTSATRRPRGLLDLPAETRTRILRYFFACHVLIVQTSASKKWKAYALDRCYSSPNYVKTLPIPERKNYKNKEHRRKARRRHHGCNCAGSKEYDDGMRAAVWPILTSCKQIYDEGLPIFYDNLHLCLGSAADMHIFRGSSLAKLENLHAFPRSFAPMNPFGSLRSLQIMGLPCFGDAKLEADQEALFEVLAYSMPRLEHLILNYNGRMRFQFSQYLKPACLTALSRIMNIRHFQILDCGIEPERAPDFSRPHQYHSSRTCSWSAYAIGLSHLMTDSSEASEQNKKVWRSGDSTNGARQIAVCKETAIILVDKGHSRCLWEIEHEDSGGKILKADFNLFG